jgi:sterol desaturase/sphingolipid hydroxylase (fatty acid hydroxylase superfamily)
LDITFELLLVLISFWSLSFWTIKKYSARALKRNLSQWALDFLGLVQQGFLFPLIQTYVLFKIFQWIIPQYKGIITISFFGSFLLQFIIIDYLYYWNHRWLHTKKLWPLHRIHHSALKLDLWVSSRNSFWSSFLIIYLWVHAFFIYLLDDAKGFLLAIAIGNALDLWRHSGLRLSSTFEKMVGRVFILPHHHEWHHSSEVYDTNFGANFVLWDKFHGTYYANEKECKVLGENLNETFWTQWLNPWRIK